MDWIKIFSSVGQMESLLVMNQPRQLIVGSKRICLVRTDDGIRAVEDKCTHNGESLSKGKVNYLGEVVCPWHSYRFNLATGRESSERSRDLITYPLKAEPDGIFIGM
ncbi:MAG: Rieske 2Fe-2S domain-containing protein [Cytophagales bacterium]|nr:Rieske 2Fe-2S domain-containing protein [Cytophagales bacterium]